MNSTGPAQLYSGGPARRAGLRGETHSAHSSCSAKCPNGIARRGEAWRAAADGGEAAPASRRVDWLGGLARCDEGNRGNLVARKLAQQSNDAAGRRATAMAAAAAEFATAARRRSGRYGGRPAKWKAREESASEGSHLGTVGRSGGRPTAAIDGERRREASAGRGAARSEEWGE
jgi:hypothetical protein